MIEEGDLVVVTRRTNFGVKGYVTAGVGAWGIVIQTHRYQGETFALVSLDEIGRRWVNSGDLQLVSDPVEILGEEYFA